jgi:peptide/nickel transport system permease protein
MRWRWLAGKNNKFEPVAPRGEDTSYWRMVRRRLWRDRTARWSLRALFVLVFVAIFADFIANERPLFCKLEGRHHWPVFKQYLVDIGLARWESRFIRTRWNEHDYERVWWAPIPYSANTMDRDNRNFRGPFAEQNVPSWRFRHWLGTDQLGRDVTAGMVRGARIALLVGIVAMSVAAFIGISLGALAGYFGDNRLRVSRAALLYYLLATAAAAFVVLHARQHALREGPFLRELGISLGIFALALASATLLARATHTFTFWKRPITLPADLLIMRLIEIINALPSLLLILAVVAIVRKPSILYVMAIIGALSWTGIARFTRAEILRIRRLEYIEAARALGYSQRRIILRHALPNALRPAMTAIGFGIAGAVLLEAALSFIGIGLPPDEITWGKMLNLARYNFKAWWLAVFPGMAIFLTVTIFNLLGEALNDALDPRLAIKSLDRGGGATSAP